MKIVYLPLTRLLCLLAALACSSTAFAQPTLPNSQERRTVAAERMTAGESITLDGNLDEAVWQRAQVATDFVQVDPDNGQPATEQTELRIAFDGDAIYLGVICHDAEAKGFLAGKHGMRLAEGLTPMTPRRAQQPMHAKAHDKQLSCTSCHGAHRFDTKKAAVEACVGCHRDRHTQAYERSPHFALWKKELAGAAPAGSGVSCASCHLPREEHRARDSGAKRILVQHNQNDNLRPSEKMIRPVCMSCHGLGYSIDALADSKLIQDNFLGQPRARVKSLDMAAQRLKELEEKRASRRAAAGAQK